MRAPILEPAAVFVNGQGFSVIGGERRVAAALANGDRSITLYEIRTWREFLAWMMLDEVHRPGPQGYEQPMNLVDAAWWTRKVLRLLKVTRFDYADQAMGEYVGQLPARIRDVRYQLKHLDHPDQRVRDYTAGQLGQVARGEASGSTIGGRITAYVKSLASMPVAQQRRTLEAASAQAAGLAMALAPLADVLTDELTPHEVETYIRHLYDGRLQMERVIRVLKKITKERST